MSKTLTEYCTESTRLAGSQSSAEETYYPAIKTLLSEILKAQGLPGDVRVNTKERRSGGGLDRPDVAIYDGTGDFILVSCEVKTPGTDVMDIALSSGQNDQVGRYLAQTKVVIVSNVRAFALVTAPNWDGEGPVPVASRTVTAVAEVWSSVAALTQGHAPNLGALSALGDLLDEAITLFAPLAEPQSVARVLARQAKRAKAAMPQEFGLAVKGLAEDFGQALGIKFEGEDGEEFFRSSLVQTVFYGLFAAWTLWYRAGASGEFRWRDVPEHLQIPFLGSLFYDIQHPSRIKDLRLVPFLDQAEATLERVEPVSFFHKLEPHAWKEDSKAEPASAITYFYEPFLEAFDPELRKQLGVWYTPPEIVQYQVRKVHELLRTELGMPLGLADDRVVVLDPCCGTGAYLIETLQTIAHVLREEGVSAELGDRLRQALTRRVIGFEILTAPFVIAHLQLYLLLQNMGAEPQGGERMAVFLTNALTGWDGSEQMKLNFPELQAEHDAARAVKCEAKVIVVIGNPPYNRWAGAAIDDEQTLVDHYKGIKRRSKEVKDRKTGRKTVKLVQDGPSELWTKWKVRKQLLDDLYIRFFRLAEKRIGERAEHGVVSFISNYSFQTGRSHPIMRESLLQNFTTIWIDNLNGDKYKTGKTIPQGLPGAGTADQSIFTTAQDTRGIQVGTAITTLLKCNGKVRTGTVNYREFWGLADDKRSALLAVSTKPGSLHTPTADRRWKLIPYDALGGYEDWPAVDELFPDSSMGVHTGKDKAVIAMDREALAARAKAYLDPSVSDSEMLSICPTIMERANEFDDPAAFRAAMQKDPESSQPNQLFRYYAFRPLDKRAIWYDTKRRVFGAGEKRWSGCLVQRYGEKFRDYLSIGNNQFLMVVPEARQASEIRPLYASGLADLHLHDRGTYAFPMFVMPTVVEENLFVTATATGPLANIAPTAWQALASSYGLAGDLHGEDARWLVTQLFRLALAVGHAPQFELDHGESLLQDWMHVPIPRNRLILEEISKAGEKVACLLDPFSDARPVLRETLGDHMRTLAVLSLASGAARPDYGVTYTYYGGGKGRWEPQLAPSDDWPAVWGDQTGDLYLNKTTFLYNVPERLWKFELGGYPVIKKWLGYRDRKRHEGKPLTQDELAHLRSIVHRIAALHLLYSHLDALYEKVTVDAFTAEELCLR